MDVIVDTNVIVDILNDDPLWASWGKLRLAEYEGDLLINPIIYAELSYRAQSLAEVDQIVDGIGYAMRNFRGKRSFLPQKHSAPIDSGVESNPRR